jgi:4-hydroxy-3-polyprenylbenzoate decarboxylase
MSHEITIGVTGASGAILAERLIRELRRQNFPIHLLMTTSAREVIRYELRPQTDGFCLHTAASIAEGDTHGVTVERLDNLFSRLASGSSAPRLMALVPCSMGTLSRVATGASTNLLERAADVILKESGRLVIVPRESPLNLIHLRHLTTLCEAGARIVPPMPAFYTRPTSLDAMVDQIVGRILQSLDIPSPLTKAWQGPPPA